MKEKIFHEVQAKIDEGFKNNSSKEKIPEIKSTEILYQDLEEELLRLMNLTKENLFIDNKYHSLFIYGPTGVGKTEITEKIAKKMGFIYHKLEIQKVPIEILQGFPYLETVEEKQFCYPELQHITQKEFIRSKLLILLNHENDDSPLPFFQSSNIEEIKEAYRHFKNMKKNVKKKIAKLAPSTILPPSDDDRCWVLHFDEFNKADMDKMAAVMNLILTGELGGSADFNGEKSVKYKLPRRTVIIGTGNAKSQEAVENLNVVSNMDIATSERWHRTCFLEYNVTSWLKNFASKPFYFRTEYLETRIPLIILNFIIDKTIDLSNEKNAFLLPIISGSKEGMESERTTSPRSWTMVADNIIIDGYLEWKKEKKESFNDFMKKPFNQISLLSKQIYEFGLNGKDLVQEIISRYIYFAENRILPDDVLFNYSKIRNKVNKIKEKQGVILYILLGIGYFINSSDTYYKNIEKIGLNLATFIKDTNVSVEDLAAFIYIIDSSENKNSERIQNFLFDYSEKYRNAHTGYYYTSIKELKVAKESRKSHDKSRKTK